MGKYLLYLWTTCFYMFLYNINAKYTADVNLNELVRNYVNIFNTLFSVIIVALTIADIFRLILVNIAKKLDIKNVT